MVTLNPTDLRRSPNEADIIPFPSDEVTPPVTKIYFLTLLVFMYSNG